jgi:hypothetical protein
MASDASVTSNVILENEQLAASKEGSVASKATIERSNQLCCYEAGLDPSIADVSYCEEMRNVEARN